MNKPTTHRCPVCLRDIPTNGIFLVQFPKEAARPIACVGCVRGLYWSIQPNEGVNDRGGIMDH